MVPHGGDGMHPTMVQINLQTEKERKARRRVVVVQATPSADRGGAGTSGGGATASAAGGMQSSSTWSKTRPQEVSSPLTQCSKGHRLQMGRISSGSVDCAVCKSPIKAGVPVLYCGVCTSMGCSYGVCSTGCKSTAIKIYKIDPPTPEEMIKVCAETEKFKDAVGQYKHLGGQAEVINVEYIENLQVAAKYEKQKAMFATQGKTGEIWVFHGTGQAAVDSIKTAGFKVGGQDGVPIANGKAFGNGIYTATGPATPEQYSSASSASMHQRYFMGGFVQSSKQVILAKGLVGTNGRDTIKPKGDWVIFTGADQLLPVYVLHLR